jgi:SAM-dependent methyltransferase
MTHAADHSIGWARSRPPIRLPETALPRLLHCRDLRWPAVAAALHTLRAANRCSVRIVDAHCGAGTLLLCAARYARALGFTAIEARGIDDSPALIERALASAAAVQDMAIGLTFEAASLIDALDDESAFPADIVIWRGRAGYQAEERVAVACAGRTLIPDPAMAA